MFRSVTTASNRAQANVENLTDSFEECRCQLFRQCAPNRVASFSKSRPARWRRTNAPMAVLRDCRSKPA